jgi:two-component system chemotaxis response regulator CheY
MPSVLIVDDDAGIRQLLRLLFELNGFHVVAEACNGAEAMPLALRHNPDFVVLDYWMPGGTGDRAAAALRWLLPEVHIIAFSAVLQEKPAWADAYLNKDRICEIAPFLTGLLVRS